MGIYTSNRYFNEAYDYASEIPANEAYDAAFGCAHILADCQKNEMALFESTIYSDFAEVRAMQEGYGYVNENAFTNVIKKIVEMFKKLLAKIKGIFSAFIAKLRGAFMDGKKLVKKYEKQIIKYGNWKGFKCKNIRKPTKDNENIVTKINDMFKANDSGIKVNYIINFTANSENILQTGLDGLSKTKAIEDAEPKDIKDKIVSKYITGITDIDDLHEEVMDKLFDDKDTIDEDEVKSSSYFSAPWIKSILNDSEKTEKEIKKYNERVEKNINTIIDNLGKADDALAKFISANQGATISHTDSQNFGKADSTTHKVNKQTYDYTNYKTTEAQEHDTEVEKHTTETVQKAIHALQKLANNEQEVITKVTAEYLAIFKFAVGQARKLWSAAAAWSSGVHKESVEYAEAVGESKAEEFYINMEAVC